MARAKMIDDTELLAAFGEIDSPVVTVADLAKRVALGKDAVRYRLKAMEDDGRVRSKKVGASAVVWWRID